MRCEGNGIPSCVARGGRNYGWPRTLHASLRPKHSLRLSLQLQVVISLSLWVVCSANFPPPLPGSHCRGLPPVAPFTQCLFAVVVVQAHALGPPARHSPQLGQQQTTANQTLPASTANGKRNDIRGSNSKPEIDMSSFEVGGRGNLLCMTWEGRYP